MSEKQILMLNHTLEGPSSSSSGQLLPWGGGPGQLFVVGGFVGGATISLNLRLDIPEWVAFNLDDISGILLPSITDSGHYAFAAPAGRLQILMPALETGQSLEISYAVAFSTLPD